MTIALTALPKLFHGDVVGRCCDLEATAATEWDLRNSVEDVTSSGCTCVVCGLSMVLFVGVMMR